uniref:Integrase core domain containing protein n=1 Tax=Solanum tuberosum TaxID=4113 RepID=M1DX77_SOLTU
MERQYGLPHHVLLRYHGPETTPIYAAKGKSIFIAPSRRLINEDDEEYIPPATRTYPTYPRITSNRAQQIYTDARMLNEHDKMAKLVTEERRVLTDSLYTTPVIHELFQRHRSKPNAQPPLESTLLRGFPVNISEVTLRRFIYGPDHTLPINTTEFHYRMGIIQSGEFQRNAKQRESLLRWLAQHLATDGEHAKWVGTPSLGIRKATLIFVAKFLWLLVRNRLSTTQAVTLVRWDWVVTVATMVAGFEIHFTRVLITEIQERVFKATTTLPFPCLIFQLCKDASVLVWHCERLLNAYKTLDICLIMYDSNLAAPHREPQVEGPPLEDDFAADVEKMQVDDTTPPAPTTDAQAPPSSATS